MTAPLLPTINAGFNALSAALLTAGFLFIRKKNVAAHRRCMTGAFLSSVFFLAGYLLHHARAGHVRFQGAGLWRSLYLLLLLSHTVLAAAVVPLVVTTLALAARERFDRHRVWARWTWPVWMYVSVTGVAIYFALYQFP